MNLDDLPNIDLDEFVIPDDELVEPAVSPFDVNNCEEVDTEEDGEGDE